jgi:prepilin-type N-terminal cleavage/methylation domain-containing protein
MKIRLLNKKQLQQGWSLAEVMVAVVVLAIVFVSLFVAFSYGFTVIRTTREDLRATQILTQKIEGIRLCTWTQLSSCPTNFTDTYATLGNTNSSVLVYNGTITRSQNSTLPTGTYGYRDQVQLITVTVTWKTPGVSANDPAVTHTRSMQTESAMYGLQNYLFGLTNSI